jgi:outer membrane protein OmpA-like peptidoglycan-associated protein
MFVKTFATASLFIISASFHVAAGEVAYKAEDVVRFFTSGSPQVATRGICVGTAEECGLVQPRQKPLTFNLMVNFEKNSAKLTGEAKANLDEFSKALKDPRLAAATFAVDGYTDASGTERYNLGLSERRAQSVGAYLTGRGVEAAKLVAKGFGETNPIAQDPYDPVNRRVETSLVVR